MTTLQERLRKDDGKFVIELIGERHDAADVINQLLAALKIAKSYMPPDDGYGWDTKSEDYENINAAIASAEDWGNE